MSTFYIEFTGRLNTAIGITSPMNAEIEATTYEEARLKLYDTYEHISVSYCGQWQNGQLVNWKGKGE